MKRFSLLALQAAGLLSVAIACVLGSGLSAADSPALVAQPPIALPRAPGRFDYMAVDDRMRRLLVAHTGNRTLDIVNVTSGEVVHQVDVGEGHGIAIDVKDGKYFVGVSRPTATVDVGRRYMVKQNNIQTKGAIDAITFDPKNGTVYADDADNGQIIAINGKFDRISGTIPIGGDLEYIDYDPIADRIYQNISDTAKIAVIDPSRNAVIATWPAAPAANLTGLAIDSASHRLFSAGSNGKLVVLDTTSGAVISTVDIAPSVDQIGFDPGRKRVYCASGTGLLSVVQETESGAELVANITVPRHAHTLAIDPTTHAVWISYGAPESDYVMKLIPPPPAPTPIASP